MVPDIASAYKGRMKVADLDTAEKSRFLKNKVRNRSGRIEFANDLDVVRVTMDPYPGGIPCRIWSGNQGCPESMLGEQSRSRFL